VHQSPDFLFLVQMLCVNNVKVISNRKYGDTGVLPGDAWALVAGSGYRVCPLCLWGDLLCR
jgi:hypothetical protein